MYHHVEMEELQVQRAQAPGLEHVDTSPECNAAFASAAVWSVVKLSQKKTGDQCRAPTVVQRRLDKVPSEVSHRNGWAFHCSEQ